MPPRLPPVTDRDHILGAETAEATLVEYGDFGCSHCFAAKLPVASLLQRFPSMRLVWRHFPETKIHPGADLAAELSELAAVHGAFWQAHSLLLTGRQEFNREDLEAKGRELGLDPIDVSAALDERSYRDRVLDDVSGAHEAGVRATPTFFLNGDRVDGHWRDLAELVPAAVDRRRHA